MVAKQVSPPDLSGLSLKPSPEVEVTEFSEEQHSTAPPPLQLVDEDGRNELGEEEKAIAVMGITGVGKSYLIRDITGQPVVVSDSLEACTQKVQGVTMKYRNSNLTLLDSPGFNDTYRSDTDILYDISSYLGKTYQQGLKLSGILYLHSIKDNKLQGPSRRSLHMFRKLVGAEAMYNVIFVTTHWSEVTPEVGNMREEQLKTKFWKDMIDNGARVVRYFGNRDSGLSILDMLTDKQRVVLDIQRELVDQRRNLIDTGAGQVLNEELLKMKNVYENKLAQAKDEMDTAIKNKDEQTKKDVAKAIEEIEAKLKASEQDSQALRKVRFQAERDQRELMNKIQLIQIAGKKKEKEWTKKQEELQKSIQDLEKKAGSASSTTFADVVSPLATIAETAVRAFILYLNH